MLLNPCEYKMLGCSRSADTHDIPRRTAFENIADHTQFTIYKHTVYTSHSQYP